VGRWGGLPYKETNPKIKEAALKALALDPEPHWSLAFIKLWSDWDWSGAEAELKQTIELNPNFADAHFGCSVHLVTMERLDVAGFRFFRMGRRSIVGGFVQLRDPGDRRLRRSSVTAPLSDTALRVI
jgi:hypothetical protein